MNKSKNSHSSGDSISSNKLQNWLNNNAANIFLLPSIIIILLLSVFPLIISAYLALSRFKFVRGGFNIKFVGLKNFKKLIMGSEKKHFRGMLGDISIFQWVIVALFTILLIYFLWRYLKSKDFNIGGLIYRLISFSILSWGIYFIMQNLSPEGRPGTVVVTLIYVFVGLFFQYFIGLGLALLTTQNLPGKRIFRVIFLLPMMITPVGVGYTFRMMTDTSKGPLEPLWKILGLGDFSWVTNAWGARWAVIITDTWQWTPFIFIILLAAIEGLRSSSRWRKPFADTLEYHLAPNNPG